MLWWIIGAVIAAAVVAWGYMCLFGYMLGCVIAGASLLTKNGTDSHTPR